MEQREEIKKEKNTTAINNRNSLKSLSPSSYLSVHPMNCVKCVWLKSYLYNLARNETIRRVFSFFPANRIRSTGFRPKEGFSAENLGNHSVLTVSVRIYSFSRNNIFSAENMKLLTENKN
jgi:hypothetical protein